MVCLNKHQHNQQFQRTQYNDKIKTEYCKQNNIQLIRIPYIEFNNIKIILSNLLN